MTSRGQMLALAIAFLAAFLLAALANYRELTPEPQVVVKRDWVQAASVASLGRLWVWFASRRGFFCPIFMRSTTAELYRLNETYGLGVPLLRNLTRLQGEGDEAAGYALYQVLFIRPWRGAWRSYVNVTVRSEYELLGTYYRKVSGEEVLYVRYRLRYWHLYEGPWGRLKLCDLGLRDPLGDADLERVGECEWLVGFPASMGNYTLEDEFGIRVGVGWAWTSSP